MTERRYYFQITSCNVIDCVIAGSLTEAKAQAFEQYGHKWPELEWLNVDTVTESIIHG